MLSAYLSYQSFYAFRQSKAFLLSPIFDNQYNPIPQPSKEKNIPALPFFRAQVRTPPPPRGPHSIHSMMEIKYSCFLLLLLLLLPPPPAAFGCERAASPQRRGKKGQQKSPRPPSLAAEVLVECCAAFLCSGLRKEGHR